ncbi:hypothetical protein GOBAR_DD06306 [Gossypium barbadense]|nr:hypothetical protein GOBAR_DD06306 [Gossypium barbadense]
MALSFGTLSSSSSTSTSGNMVSVATLLARSYDPNGWCLNIAFSVSRVWRQSTQGEKLVKYNSLADDFLKLSFGHEITFRNTELLGWRYMDSALDQHDNYKAFQVEDICKLMNYFYSDDFMEQEKLHMKIQLEHFQLDPRQSTELQKTSTVVKLCQELPKTNRSKTQALASLGCRGARLKIADMPSCIDSEAN